jgi:nitroreductase
MQVFSNQAKAYFIGMNNAARTIPVRTPETEVEAPALSFSQANERRRAIRHFDARPVPEAKVRSLLSAALLAPSSGNLQPYRLHWVSNSTLKSRIAEACEGQRAATSAPTLIVVVANPRFGIRTADQQLAALEHSTLPDESKRYYRSQLTKFRRFLSIAPLWLLSPLRVVLSWWSSAYSLLPLGPSGTRHWAARSALLSAQTLMLAAAADGIDTCPMEGFNAAKVARLLALPRGSVIPLVIAVGYRAAGARVEPQSRREYAEAVVEHG